MPDDAWQRIEKSEQPLRVKFGIDPTRDRLHLGHFVPLRLVRKLQEAGHEVDLVLGTLTARLGDPSGQDKTRPILTEDEVIANAKKLLAQCQQVLLPGFRVHLNHTFTEAMSIPLFLTQLVSNVTVASMLARDGFRKRMAANQPIALHELLVPLLQGWDSVQLGAQVEIGGTDQLFNFQVARRLQESEGFEPQMALMTPVINGTDGRKMSKSFDNTIWLDEIPHEIFGQVMSVSDETMEQWIPLLTDGIDESHPMERKKALARDIIAQLQGMTVAMAAQRHFEAVIQRQELGTVQDVGQDTLVIMVAKVRSESRTRARKLIEGGGVRINDIKVFDPGICPPLGAILRVGKRRFARVV